MSDIDSDNEISFYSQAADNFVLAEGMSTVTGIHWWGTSGVADDYAFVRPLPEHLHVDDFYVTFYLDDGGLPGAELAAYHLGSPPRTVWEDGASWLGYAYTWLLPEPLVLSPSSVYWLSIQNDFDGDEAWAWTTIGPDGDAARNWGGGWESHDRDLAFQLINDVPEPGTLSLMALGISFAIAARFRRRRRA